jgi:F-box and WD-40 domain protein 1/11
MAQTHHSLGPDLFHHPSSSSSITRVPSQLDEGYSEDTRSQDADSEMTYANEVEMAMQNAITQVMLLPEEQRKQVIERLIGTLPNALKEHVGQYCVRLTHFDPVHSLPSELMFDVLSYMTPKDLLACGTVSKSWREMAQDDKLWRSCFAREGWLVDRGKLDKYESWAKKKGPKYVEGKRAGRRGMLERKGSRKRKPGEAFSDVEAVQTEGSGDEVKMDGTPDAAPQGHVSDSDSMEGVDRDSPVLDGNIRTMSPSDALMETGISRRSSFSFAASSHTSPPSLPSPGPSPADFSPSPKLFRPGPPENPKLSWPYMYKMRARLESNWEREGAHKMFSLPHPSYPQEGHTECVYTIQHTSRYLVSGSRDKTIRKWDLNTCRLIGEPMSGHEMSVLCLQFDDRPEHDIIVSGGSDAHVVIWQFSTGKMLKKLANAHTESVLNLRFDERYIVTCSKDKSIKVWNRRAVAKDDPMIPEAMIDLWASLPDHLCENPGPMVPEYTLLATLTGHNAAVNAVMIHDTTIISASGDRTIKSWDIKKTHLNKTYVGHTKGIACVQFDGRRIVSGSSDNTVRIFDAENMAEVACLAGHANLVRTVQARFGDLDIVTDKELEDEAKQADRNFFRALENGMNPASASRGAPRNAGSSRPEDMLSLGTKVPPGGGGSRWAKIVSGSYDESVIIWKRDREGRWVKKQTLKQDELLNAHFRPGRYERRIHGARIPTLPAAPAPAANNNSAATQVQTALHHIQHLSQALQNGALNGTVVSNGQMSHLTTVQNQLHHQVQSQNQTSQNQTSQNQTQNQQNGNNAAPAAQQTNNPPAAPAGAQQPANNNQPPAAPVIQPQQHHPHAPVAPNRPHTSESNRVFKLQFDARRIICCSQNKVIVGWDFANGDPELERMGDWSVETA